MKRLVPFLLGISVVIARDVLQTAIQVYATGFSTFCKGFAFYSEEDAHPHF